MYSRKGSTQREKETPMFKSFSMDLAGRKLTVEVGRVAAQANGAAFMHYGDSEIDAVPFPIFQLDHYTKHRYFPPVLCHVPPEA